MKRVDRREVLLGSGALLGALAVGAPLRGSAKESPRSLPAAAENQCHLAPGPQLFIDDFMIETSSGLTRTLHQPKKIPQPILGGQDWYQRSFVVRVIYDSEASRFRMWFGASPARHATGYCAYAESKDGLAWNEPNLGLVEIAGSKNNNAIIGGGSVLLDRGRDFPERQKRYVALSLGKKNVFLAQYSPDGLRFTEDPRNPIYEDATGSMGDILMGCWDPLHRRYLITIKYVGTSQDGYRGKPHYADEGRRPGEEGRRRLVGQLSTEDLVHWSPFRRIIASDPEEPAIEEFYSMVPTVRGGGLYLGFLRPLRDDLPADPGGPVEGIAWTELCTSRDGENWTRHKGIFLDRDPKPGTFDHAHAWVSDVVTFGDTDFIYYRGHSAGHKVGMMRAGVATLRRDGFVSRDAGAEGGMLRTRLFTLEGARLTVNADAKGELRVRVLDPSGLPFRGFFFQECEQILGDKGAHKVRWSGDLASLQGKLVRLEFSLRDTQLYGFELA